MQRHTAATENLGSQRRTTTPLSPPLRLPVPVTTLPAALRLLPLAVSSASQSPPPFSATSQATASVAISSQICSPARTPLPQLRRSDPPAFARATPPPPPRSAATVSAYPPLAAGDPSPESHRRAAQLIIFCQTATVYVVQASLGSFVASTSSSCSPPL